MTAITIPSTSKDSKKLAGVTPTAAGLALLDDATATVQRTTLGLGSVATLAVDTDVNLAANSDAVVASQKATKAYVLAHAGGGGGGSMASQDSDNVSISGGEVDSVGMDGCDLNNCIIISCDISNLNSPILITDGGTGSTTASGARSNLGLGTASTLASDTDTALSANSDLRVATQKATKAYADALVVGLLDYKGATDCSGSPNYPAALKGDSYAVSVAGKIGGASGKTVEVGDWYIAKADNAGGTEASVGTNWNAIQNNLVGALLAANNLSDIASVSTARTNLGLGSMATQAAGAVAISGGEVDSVGMDGCNLANCSITTSDIFNLNAPIAITDGGTGATSASAARSALGLGTAATLASDTDTTLAANSDSRVATQKAVKAYADALVANLLELKGSITNANSNPNYPVASAGDAYVIATNAGKVGGASGKSVDTSDMVVALFDNAGGTEASVGTSWVVLEHNLVGALLRANNLSDVANAGTARTNLGVGITDAPVFQGVTVGNDDTPGVLLVIESAGPSTTITLDGATGAITATVFNGEVAASNISGTLGVSHGGTGATDAAGVRASFGLVIGTNVQAFSSVLSTYAGITPSANVQSLLGAANYAAVRSALSLGTVALLASDTDTALTANSDSNIATQKAVKTYVDASVVGLLDYKGATDCSASPNYPAASKGDAYFVSVAGKIGGASGKSVDAGDLYIAKADNAGGTEASVGTNWNVVEHNLTGALLAANNLSDITNAGTARSNLGLVIGTNVQAYDADLITWASITPSASVQTLLGSADYAAFRSSLGAAIPGFRFTSDPNASTAITVADGKAYFRVPAWMNGYDIVGMEGSLDTASSSGVPTFQLRRKRSGSDVDVLSTKFTIDASETDSSSAATPAVINASNDDLATGDRVYLDCDVAGTGAKGADFLVLVRKP